MKILAIDTSCDETAAAVTAGRRALSNVVYSQVLVHKPWGGVVPSLAKRAHEERIDQVVDQALKKQSDLGAIAVTQGPGLAIALEVGIRKAKELSAAMNLPLIAVNHMEGHLYSPFVQNSHGNPPRDFHFPYLGVLISGSHSEFILWSGHLEYKVIGETVDDAAGEALDKAARLLLNIGYPGGAAIEQIAQDAGNTDVYKFTRPMLRSGDLNLSFSGLKTTILYLHRSMTEEERVKNLKPMVSSFQEAVFDTIIRKLEKAIIQTGVNRLAVGGGVIANRYFRKKLRSLAAKYAGNAIFPAYKYLTGDNAAMIGVAAKYRAERGLFIMDHAVLERTPRMQLGNSL